ncbi:MAG: hypothetical protein HY698_01365 [Deltaproteobacteria bacterium]|nr:hypothetical protein [Deltaproteobacteria bacterium]
MTRARGLFIAVLSWTAWGCGESGKTAENHGADATPPDAMIRQPYTIKALDKARITSVGGTENFQRVRAPIEFKQGPFAKVTLKADLSTTCYPFETWQANPPPPSQNWPADCDAFDRNYEFLLDEPEKEGNPPAFELVRAITPFGGPIHLEADITDIANAKPGAHVLTVFIATWSDGAGKVTGSAGGWNVNVEIDVVPGTPPRNVLAAVPLVNGSLGAGAAFPEVKVQVPAGTKSTRLEYRVTGHGGGEGTRDACIGPAEEFCERTHRVIVDGVTIDEFKPVRLDCDKLCTIAQYRGRDYCLENPCGLIESVRAPRANWCPGSETPPYSWDPEALRTPGEHKFSFSINTIAPGGSWRVSSTFYAYGD